MPPAPTTYAVKTASHTDQGLFRGHHSSKRVDQQRAFRRHGSKLTKMKIIKGKVLLGPKAVALDHFLNFSLTWASIVCVLTIWALYSEDLKGIYIAKEYDSLFASVNWIIFIV